MNPAYKTRTSDEALDEHLQQLKATVANRQQQHSNHNSNARVSKSNKKVQSHQKARPPPPLQAANLPPVPPAPAPEPPVTNTTAQTQPNTASATRLRSDSTATSIYVTAGDNHAYSNHANTSNPATMDRKQEHRLSWINMRRRGDGLDTMQQPAPITPSPQTTRSYISNITTTELHSNRDDDRIDEHAGYRDSGGGSGGGGGGSGGQRNASLSGRTTTSGRASSVDGVTTICGSSNTLNDIHSDYHSQDVGGSREFQNFSRIISGSVVDGIGAASSPMKHKLRNSHLNYTSANGSFNMANGSTVKLISQADDEANQQTKCSVFRGIILCICLNVTYANVVRFPRELDSHGLVYLIPYLILLFLVGLPVVLLEISVGQFLGQGAAHTWRASPIFKGACVISRFSSWISTVWVSLQAIMALGFIGMYTFNTMPFRECLGPLRISAGGYTFSNNSGQECMQKTFLTPFWENPLYFGLLSIGLIVLWAVVMLCTHNSRVVRRFLFVLGLLGALLLCSLCGWEVRNALCAAIPSFPDFGSFDKPALAHSHLWFSALMQVIFALNCGSGVLPMITGKFLYKGDAVRTSVIYLCFNLLINAIAVALFMLEFQKSLNGGDMIAELKPLTAIYDRILQGNAVPGILQKILPSLIYSLVVISCLISIVVGVYTCTRLVPRHPNYVISLVGLVSGIICLSAPRFQIARVLDSRVVGTMLITSLVFELIALTWIYGAKNIYTDLEFSIGRPILKAWITLWCICPAVLTGLLVWWCSDDDQYDVLATVLPRWAPILFVLFFIIVIACVQIFRQVEYNFFGMICEASKSAKEWGPADPLARHAWKQWRSVCQDTGQRDFTLRRRGTRDYTHSIKKGQYSTSNKYANGQTNGHHNWKSSTPGNSSPNYSGSVFGDSAIEEDISVDKFPGISQQFVPFQNQNDNKPLRYSHRSRAQQRVAAQVQHQQPASHYSSQQLQQQHLQQQLQHQHHNGMHHSQAELRNSNPDPSHSAAINAPAQKHREIVYIRRMSSEDGGGGGGAGQHATRIEITPSNESISYAPSRNPLGRSSGSHGNSTNYVKRTNSMAGKIENNRNSMAIVGKLPPSRSKIDVGAHDEHICWRKFSMNPEEYSTEL